MPRLRFSGQELRQRFPGLVQVIVGIENRKGQLTGGTTGLLEVSFGWKW